MEKTVQNNSSNSQTLNKSKFQSIICNTIKERFICVTL